MTNQNYGIWGGSALKELYAMRFGFDGSKNWIVGRGRGRKRMGNIWYSQIPISAI
jgi:hypothetical protein